MSHIALNICNMGRMGKSAKCLSGYKRDDFFKIVTICQLACLPNMGNLLTSLKERVNSKRWRRAGYLRCPEERPQLPEESELFSMEEVTEERSEDTRALLDSASFKEEINRIMARLYDDEAGGSG